MSSPVPTSDEEWTRVVRPNKVLAKITFASPEDLAKNRKKIFQSASETCNILFSQVFPKADPPFINLHLESQHSLLKLKEKLSEYHAEEVARTSIDENRKAVIISNSPRTSLEQVKTRLKDFGPLIYVSQIDVPRSPKRFFTVAYEDEESRNQLLKHPRLYIGKDLIAVEKPRSTTKKAKKSPYVAKLTNLPLATTDWDLNNIMETLNARHWRIPYSKNYKRIPICFVAFDNEDDLFMAMKTKLRLGNYELLWSKPDENLCERCLSSEHSFKSCNVFARIAEKVSRPIPSRQPVNMLTTPTLSFASVVKEDSRYKDFHSLKETYEAPKGYNDLLEEEILRTIKLKALKKKLESDNFEDLIQLEADLHPKKGPHDTNDMIQDHNGMNQVAALVQNQLESFKQQLQANVEETQKEAKTEVNDNLSCMEEKIDLLMKFLEGNSSTKPPPITERNLRSRSSKFIC